jgi:hypothetical protein
MALQQEGHHDVRLAIEGVLAGLLTLCRPPMPDICLTSAMNGLKFELER